MVTELILFNNPKTTGKILLVFVDWIKVMLFSRLAYKNMSLLHYSININTVYLHLYPQEVGRGHLLTMTTSLKMSWHTLNDCEWRTKQMQKNFTADGLVLKLYAAMDWKLWAYLVSVLLTVNRSWLLLFLLVDKPLSPALELSCRMFSQHRQSKWLRAAAAEPPAKTRQCSSNVGQTVQQHKQSSALSLTNNHLSAREKETTLTVINTAPKHMIPH